MVPLKFPIAAIALCLALASTLHAQTNPWFGVHIVDDRTNRGVPLAELETVNHVQFISDSAGWIAINEPGLMGQAVYFGVRSHGYSFKKDGFGFSGVTLTPSAGGRAEIRLTRVNVAERLYRITGEGIYRDSVLLGEKTPTAEPLGSGKVMGQDSAFALAYHGSLYWFWGDTNRIRYPLGHFWMAGATSDLPSHGGLDPALGINLTYFIDKDGFSRPVCRLGVDHGPVWSDAFAVLPDDGGTDRLVCHYAHMASLAKMLDHGLAMYDDDKKEFVKIAEFPMADLWRFPGQAHPLQYRDNGKDYLYLGQVFPTVRVPATLAQFKNLDAYEAWSCLEENSAGGDAKVARDAQGHINWRWTSKAAPVDEGRERRLIDAGKIKPDEARMNLRDVDSDRQVSMSRGSVCWNEHRKKFVMIACQQGGTSALGEIWYAEAAAPTGPWSKAKKIATHVNYSFYNPAQHPMFDQEVGRLIYFEGTYTQTFSGNPVATPRYDYNQIMYRVDLDDPRLAGTHEQAATK